MVSSKMSKAAVMAIALGVAVGGAGVSADGSWEAAAKATTEAVHGLGATAPTNDDWKDAAKATTEATSGLGATAPTNDDDWKDAAKATTDALSGLGAEMPDDWKDAAKSTTAAAAGLGEELPDDWKDAAEATVAAAKDSLGNLGVAIQVGDEEEMYEQEYNEQMEKAKAAMAAGGLDEETTDKLKQFAADVQTGDTDQAKSIVATLADNPALADWREAADATINSKAGLGAALPSLDDDTKAQLAEMARRFKAKLDAGQIDSAADVTEAADEIVPDDWRKAADSTINAKGGLGAKAREAYDNYENHPSKAENAPMNHGDDKEGGHGFLIAAISACVVMSMLLVAAMAAFTRARREREDYVALQMDTLDVENRAM